MELSRKYRKMLDRLKDEPEFKQRVAEQRLLFITGFLYDFERSEIKRMGSKFSRRKAIIEFCKENDLCPATFTAWLQNYQAKGINGLVPAYGNRKGSSPYTDAILPIIAEIIAPGDGVSVVYKKLVPLCRQLDIKAPSQKTVGRMMEAYGLISTKGRGRKITTIKAYLDVDTQRPLASLQQLSNFIRECDVFSPEVKETSLNQLGSFLKLISREKPLRLSEPLTIAEIKALTKYKAGLHKKHSAKATAILMVNGNAALAEVVKITGRHPATILKWIKLFNEKRVEFVKVRLHNPERDKRIEERRARIIDIIHTPPSEYCINRTTWNYSSVARIYSEKYGERISTKTIERAVKVSGQTWRHVRKVWTSLDPDYIKKVERLLDTLQGLKNGERFFFIDEVGPYRVKKYGGRVLMPKDQTPTVLEYQKNRGKIQFVAALEAVTNQLTWMFTANKCAPSVIGLIEKLTVDYADSSAIFLTWDAISVHGSKAVMEWIAANNEDAKGPHIEVVPLPSKSQFLNVIESVFGGMKKAVICNSDYATPHDMQEAIARHFEERNQYYRDNPKRAGNKIWDKQRFDFNKLAGGLFKKM